MPRCPLRLEVNCEGWHLHTLIHQHRVAVSELASTPFARMEVSRDLDGSYGRLLSWVDGEMKKAYPYVILGWVMASPHLNDGVAFVLAAYFFICAALEAWRES
jgi:hypothetical protein